MKSALDFLQSKVKLSPAERRLLELLPKDGGRMTTDELRKRFYDKNKPPFNSRIVVSGTINNLVRKTRALRGSPIRVHRSVRRGPHPTEVWIEQRS